MNDFALARAAHVLSIVWWIGGVAFVTLTLLPACRALAAPAARIELFENLEHRFGGQARWATVLAGLSGLWLTHRLGAWERFLHPAQWWWMHAMVAIWLIFSLMLFVLEPLVLHRWFRQRAASAPVATFALIEKMHRILLAASLITVTGAVVGSHGGWWM